MARRRRQKMREQLPEVPSHLSFVPCVRGQQRVLCLRRRAEIADTTAPHSVACGGRDRDTDAIRPAAMHRLVRDLYRRFLVVGRDYPTGPAAVKAKVKAAFAANAGLTEEEDLMRAVYKGRWWVVARAGGRTGSVGRAARRPRCGARHACGCLTRLVAAP
jgi:hypothetical protein